MSYGFLFPRSSKSWQSQCSMILDKNNLAFLAKRAGLAGDFRGGGERIERMLRTK